MVELIGLLIEFWENRMSFRGWGYVPDYELKRRKYYMDKIRNA